jgi:hypothetical protein
MHFMTIAIFAFCSGFAAARARAELRALSIPCSGPLGSYDCRTKCAKYVHPGQDCSDAFVSAVIPCHSHVFARGTLTIPFVRN